MSGKFLIAFDELKLTAYNGEIESYRFIRLQRVVGYVCALCESRGWDTGVLRNILELHDHKGTLVVTWIKAPKPEEQNLFLQAWKSSIGDGSDLIENKILERCNCFH